MLGSRIKRLRMDKGMSQEELASRAHVVRQTVSKWENNVSVPDAKSLITIAEALDTTVSMLLSSESDMEKDSKASVTLADLASQLETINQSLADKEVAKKRKIRIIALIIIISSVILTVWDLLQLTYDIDNEEASIIWEETCEINED